MTIDNRKILIIVILINLVAIPVVTFTTGPIRIILGIILVIFFPGYTLTSALFPKKKDLDGLERLAFSFGLSIAIVPLIGLILNYTPWGIRLDPIIIAISIFVIITAAIGYFRQQKLPANDRFNIIIKTYLPDWATAGKLDKALSFCLLITILAALSSLGYTIAKPSQGEKYTEFYLLGIDGKTTGYPQQVPLGEPANIVIGIVNHENQPTNYRIKIKIGGAENSEINMGTLDNKAKLEKKISFTPKDIGKRQKVEFQLYLNNETEPYFDAPLYLYIDVVTSSSTSTANDKHAS